MKSKKRPNVQNSKNIGKKTKKEKTTSKKIIQILIMDSDLSEKSLNFFFDDNIIEDSLSEATRYFEILIHPIKSDDFISNILENKLVLIRRNKNIFKKLFSIKILDEILKKNLIKFTENIDVVKYVDQKRQTLNESGRAHPSIIWQYFNSGCSIRMLNPQSYWKPIWKLLSLLQEHFACMAGANIYLTPADTQGFAPHWDDIDAFVLQLEGKKRWRVYSPRCEDEILPRFSSENFTNNDIGDPIFDEILHPGDLLYFPRGYIHQACCLADTHSLHITISINQRNTWTDFLHKLLPRAIDIASEEDARLRHSLPWRYTDFIGAMHSNVTDDTRRNQFNHQLKKMIKSIVELIPIDATGDQMFKNYLSSSLPPSLSSKECDMVAEACIPHCNLNNEKPNKLSAVKDKNKGVKRHSFSGNYNHISNSCNELKLLNKYVNHDSSVKLIRASIARIVCEEAGIYLHHNVDNSRVYEGNESIGIELTEQQAEAFELLVASYPNYVPISQFDLGGNDKKVEFVQLLATKGLLFVKQ